MVFLKRGSARCFGFLFCFFLPSGYKPPPQPRARSTFSFYHHPHHLAGTTRRGGHLDCIYKQGRSTTSGAGFLDFFYLFFFHRHKEEHAAMHQLNPKLGKKSRGRRYLCESFFFPFYPRFALFSAFPAERKKSGIKKASLERYPPLFLFSPSSASVFYLLYCLTDDVYDPLYDG